MVNEVTKIPIHGSEHTYNNANILWHAIMIQYNIRWTKINGTTM